MSAAYWTTSTTDTASITYPPSLTPWSPAIAHVRVQGEDDVWDRLIFAANSLYHAAVELKEAWES